MLQAFIIRRLRPLYNNLIFFQQELKKVYLSSNTFQYHHREKRHFRTRPTRFYQSTPRLHRSEFSLELWSISTTLYRIFIRHSLVARTTLRLAYEYNPSNSSRTFQFRFVWRIVLIKFPIHRLSRLVTMKATDHRRFADVDMPTTTRPIST